MVTPLSEVPKEGSSVFSLLSLIKLHLASLPFANSYSHVAVSSAFCAQNIIFSAQTRGAPLNAFRVFLKQVAAWLHDGGACAKFSLSVENGLANAGTGWPNSSRETRFSGANGDREKIIFAVQLLTIEISRIDNYPGDPYPAGSVDDT